MNLKLITFALDLTQFLVDEEKEQEAVKIAMEVNKSDFLGKWDPEEVSEQEINDPSCYEVEEVNDMEFLGEIIRRDDFIGVFDNVIVFNG